MKELPAIDIIAANVSAKKFILGTPKPINNFDPNAITVTLSLNEIEINQGKGINVLGDQWEAE